MTNNITLRNVKYLIATLFILLICFSCGSQEKSTSSDVYTQFNRWGISFEYPRGWKEHSAERVALMKNYMEEELKPYDMNLIEFTMIAGDNDGIVLLISKYVRPEEVQPSELIDERNKVYEDAMNAGDVTKINHIKETIVANLPTVEEDVERSNGGRGRTYKLILSRTIIELSFVAPQGRKFDTYLDAVNHVISTLSIVEKENKPNVEGAK